MVRAPVKLAGPVDRSPLPPPADDLFHRDVAPALLRKLAAVPLRALTAPFPALDVAEAGIGVTLGYSSKLNSSFNNDSNVVFNAGTYRVAEYSDS
jgi:hypothetical protein